MPETINLEPPPVRRPRLRRTVTLLVAAAVALAVWVVGVPLAGLDLTLGSGTEQQTVTPASVVAVPLLVGGAGWALLAFLEGRFRGGRRAWLVTAWAVLVLSLLGPVTSGASGGVLAVLLGMHVLVGVTLIVGLAPTSAR
ncbi:DUF6069 family protein [Micromonospora sp. NBC_01796]|uniref:DUF6069 family protein n=1 Tax=Micromonospora sp. NBC_01796 TaxID=2975987 RepID=UPI002DDB08FA|nr:DUF6069 family protein [Micromonospora sp. NBC_01796]WSA84340.1 DUF6069 family protein [Micromonospora sp. NBC_01796]